MISIGLVDKVGCRRGVKLYNKPMVFGSIMDYNGMN